MPAHDMLAEHWPPGASNGTGVGLWWAPDAKGHAALEQRLSADGHAPAIRPEMIPAPAGTLLLTEQANTNNILFSGQGAAISGPSHHLNTRFIPPRRYHDGKFNYLMVDGHVEALQPNQKPGIWTIRPGD